MKNSSIGKIYLEVTLFELCTLIDEQQKTNVEKNNLSNKKMNYIKYFIKKVFI